MRIWWCTLSSKSIQSRGFVGAKSWASHAFCAQFRKRFGTVSGVISYCQKGLVVNPVIRLHVSRTQVSSNVWDRHTVLPPEVNIGL